MRCTEVFDLIVLGAGIAGHTVATSAAEAGLSVLMLEKTEEVGGSSAMSGGWFAFSGTAKQRERSVGDSDHLFMQDLLRTGDGQSDRTLLRAYLAKQQETYLWLKRHGVVFRALELSAGMSAARAHQAHMHRTLSILQEFFVAAGGAIRVRHRGLRMLQARSGKVIGVVADTPGGECSFVGRDGVVLATGGFTRAVDLLQEFVPDQLSALPHGGKGNTGDGLKIARSLGAGLADMCSVSGTYGAHPGSDDACDELVTAYYKGAIVVNQDGRRFVNESVDYKTLGRAVLAQPGEVAFQIFDSKIRAMCRESDLIKDLDSLEQKGHLQKSDTICRLAQLEGIDAAALADSVVRYNRGVATATDEFGRTHLCSGSGNLIEIDTPPFYAYRSKSVMTSTYGGLTTDSCGRVLNVHQAVMENLYAVGEITGGFHGAGYMTGTSLGKATVFGRIVAQHVVRSHFRRSL
ncbi:FAD-dependent oxidoreductase [Ornithinimicrobium avium]|uniref:FAD-dependent oxidoreductase n=1 Tax=Ornithinimicrobium avium TaxID=2283195 RepID=A0A345NPK2_9MICO|nr:FAD-dependent oxidoreductase [Ornithinimicrobium avium]